jgi:15-cis-phytoene synthase
MIAPEDLAACRALLSNGSRSFALAARLLPQDIAAAATGLYAFCRVADDLIDGAAGAEAQTAALRHLRGRLDDIYRCRPRNHPEDRALACLVADYGIPRALPEALLEGFAWDAAGHRYRTLAELEAYGVRVAGTVGMMLSFLMGDRRPGQLARACDLGIAMQLTNIARDVGEDAAAGRLYLPTDWFERAGLDAAGWLQSPRQDRRIADMVATILRRADDLYRRADTGIERLPARYRVGIRAASRVYAAIGEALTGQAYDAVSRRAVVGAPRKVLLVAGAVLPRRGHGAAAESPPHPAAADLLQQVVGSLPSPERPASASSAAFLVELFLRLDRRTRMTTGPGAVE